ncbi:MAG: IS1595 family transposase [Proteobacteria bacterium]|nr:IS1595 family transposase [Pseudomonadota bacterium]
MQHHLHSKESRNFAKAISALTEDEAENLLSRSRWDSDTKQMCPKCGSFRRHYRRAKRRQWRCADCTRVFSVTSGTALHGHKLTFCQIVSLVLIFESGAKGTALLLAARLKGFAPKTIQANFGKLREMLVKNMDFRTLRGIVHMDGIYLGGKPRKPNRRMKMPKDAIKVRFGKKKPDNPDKPWISAGMTRKNWEKRKNRRVVISLCESAGHGHGSRRVMAFVCKSENETDIMRAATRFIEPGSIVMTDESPAYFRLSSRFEHESVQHAKEFSRSDGVNNNLSEAWNSRVRRHEYGVSHGFRPKYLQDYMCELVWRENFRKHSQKDRVENLLQGLLLCGKSNWWRGYWQRKHRQGEIGLDYFFRNSIA